MLHLLKRALGLDGQADGWIREAYAHHCAGELDRAEQIYRRVLAREPRHADAQYLLGEIASRRGEHGRAAAFIAGAISANGAEPQFHYALGCALQAGGNWEQAALSYRRALELDASHPGAHLNLGCILQEQAELRAAILAHEVVARDLAEASAHFQAATRHASDNADAWMNLAYAMERQRDLDSALQFYDRALALNANMAQARFNRSMVLLAKGRTSEGWEDYEWRWEASGYPRPKFLQREWDGAPLAGGKLLVYTEQGYGDAIQFARYAARAAARGMEVTLRCAPELVRLMANVPGVSRTIPSGGPLPEFDVHCPLLSLPRVLGESSGGGVPAPSPYVRLAQAEIDLWRRELAGGNELKIGLAWASQPQNRIAPLKSASLASFAALGQLSGTRFYSLQKGDAAMQAVCAEPALAICDLSERLRDFADTAALIANLDLVITVDTAVAHLAGALGKPVWTLLPYVRDWRWCPEGSETTAWYPSMRLYGQERRGDWSAVIARVARDLESLRAAPATFRT